MTSATTTTTRHRRGPVGAALMQQLPGTSLMHQVWIGTKLFALTLLTVAGFVNPNWQELVAMAAVAALGVAAARVPLNAFPRLAWWFWLPFVIGLVVAIAGHGAGHFLRLVALNLLFTLLSALVVWTTALDDLAPALRRIGTPLTRIGVPVAEWATVSALCVRSLPLLVDEMRVLRAARRQRPHRRSMRPDQWVVTTVDVLTAAMAVTIRRAADLGQAIASRGPAAPHTPPLRLGWRDAAVVVVTVAAAIVPLVAS